MVYAFKRRSEGITGGLAIDHGLDAFRNFLG